jgi:hypothetical protein
MRIEITILDEDQGPYSYLISGGYNDNEGKEPTCHGVAYTLHEIPSVIASVTYLILKQRYILTERL